MCTRPCDQIQSKNIITLLFELPPADCLRFFGFFVELSFLFLFPDELLFVFGDLLLLLYLFLLCLHLFPTSMEHLLMHVHIHQNLI